MNTKKLTEMALLTGIALALHWLESLLPPLVPVPGVRIGLANIITLMALYRLRLRDAVLVVIARVILGSIFGGSMSALLYSAAGCAVSLIVMIPLSRVIPSEAMVFPAILGAAGHNLGQISAAIAVTRTPGLIAYLPVLLLSGCIAGAFTGLCASFTVKRLNNKQMPR